MKIFKLSEVDEDFRFSVRTVMEKENKRFLYGQPHCAVRNGQIITVDYGLGDSIEEAMNNFYQTYGLGNLYFGCMLIEKDGV